jgi:transcriptional regulator with GAF, ATPase, and Fis domain
MGVEIGLGLLAIVLLLTTQNESLQNAHDNATHQTLSDIYTETETKQQVALSERISSIEHTLQSPSATDGKVLLEKILNTVCNELEACQGALYITKQRNQKRLLELTASYAYYFAESKTICYEFGEGLIGQVAKEGKTINISTIPEGYITIVSGLGSSSPNHLIIVPLLFENSVAGILEIASFKKITKTDEEYLNGLASVLGKSLDNHAHAIVNAE